jgi:hypothetical protein
LDVTTFASAGYRQKIGGLTSTTFTTSGFQDFATDGPDISFPGTTSILNGTLTPWSVSVPGTTVGDVAYFGQAIEGSITSLSGSVGEVAGFSTDFMSSGRVVRGIMAAPYAARTATGNGSAVALAGPSATQSWYVAFHVHSVTGAGSVQFVVQSDDAIGMASPTTRITSTSFTAVGSQFTSAAGAFAGETHVRVNHTITGFTSVSFSVVVGLANT